MGGGNARSATAGTIRLLASCRDYLGASAQAITAKGQASGIAAVTPSGG